MLLPLDRTWWDGWTGLADKTGGWDVVMKCSMVEKLWDVWTGRIECVTCPCKSARTAHQQVLTVLALKLNSHQNPQWEKKKEKHSLSIEQTQLRAGCLTDVGPLLVSKM